MFSPIGKALLVTVLAAVGLLMPDLARTRLHRTRRGEEPTIEPARVAPPTRTARAASPPVLLTTPEYYGTLAAVRSLGRNAVPVTTAGATPDSISSWSKYTTTSMCCPPTTDIRRFMEWLVHFGQNHQRHVLLPTCDDTAWLYARYREQLSNYFYVNSPDIEAIHNLLHKGRLAEQARAAGLDVPRSWFPTSENDLAQIAREAQFPLLVKPVTQALFEWRGKGIRVDRPEQLLPAYRKLSRARHAEAIANYDPSVERAMVQEFFPDASRSIYNISSYVRQGKLWGARAGRKLLQRPKRIGVGMCFEEAPLDERLSQGLERLAQRVGFFGVFEAEFIRTAERDLLIDFNPRFYNQMGFDVVRGLPLPALAYNDTLPEAKVPEPKAQEAEQPGGWIFTFGTALKVTLISQRLSGVLSTEELRAWEQWLAEHEGKRVDAVEDPDDVWPGRFDRLQMLRHHLRHPRDFLRTVVFDR